MAAASAGCSGREACEEGYTLVRGECVVAVEEGKALTLESAAPEDGAEDVSRSEGIKLTFSAPLDAGSVHDGTVRLVRKIDGEDVPVDVSVEGTEVILVPRTPLHVYAEHVVELDDGLKSESGRALEAEHTLTWRTRDGVWNEPRAIDAQFPEREDYVDAFAYSGNGAIAMVKSVVEDRSAGEFKLLLGALRSGESDWRVEEAPISSTTYAADIAILPEGDILVAQVVYTDAYEVHVYTVSIDDLTWSDPLVVSRWSLIDSVDIEVDSSGRIYLHYVAAHAGSVIGAYRHTIYEGRASGAAIVESSGRDIVGKIPFFPELTYWFDSTGNGLLRLFHTSSVLAAPSIVPISADDEINEPISALPTPNVSLSDAAFLEDGRANVIFYDQEEGSACRGCSYRFDFKRGWDDRLAVPIEAAGEVVALDLMEGAPEFLTWQEVLAGTAGWTRIWRTELQGDAWSTPELLTQTPGALEHPAPHRAMRDKLGHETVIWFGSPEGASVHGSLHYARRLKGGEWSAPGEVAKGPYAWNYAPALSASPGGEAVAIWYSTKDYRHYFSRFK